MEFILLVIVLVLIFISFITLRLFFFNKAPYIPSRKNVLAEIVQALELKNESVLYDLGCGDARILKAAVHSNPTIKGVGIENRFLLTLWARFNTRKLPIIIHNGDIFKTDLSKPTHIYCYLLPQLLTKLETKILSECVSGTRIVTLDFNFPTIKPVKEIELKESSILGKKLFIYDL